jgi:hypothetical protein
VGLNPNCYDCLLGTSPTIIALGNLKFPLVLLLLKILDFELSIYFLGVEHMN